ncbi:hypothetical protein MIDIC_240035 [Alphaproteobacteria bacterium]
MYVIKVIWYNAQDLSSEAAQQSIAEAEFRKKITEKSQHT